ncbi:MAG: hypothetical protein KC468_38870 [Myxococcales bacterium]|nr:hypothetical protein [Myxococcales bacterium]
MSAPVDPRHGMDVLRWTSSPRGHVESFFLKANDPRAPERALWLKWTVLAPVGRPGDAVAELWAIRFDGASGAHHAAKTTAAASACQLARDRLALEVAGAELGPGYARGGAGEGAARITWSLEFDYDDQRPMFGFPHLWMYEGGFPKGKLYTSCPQTRVTGTIERGGERWRVDGWPGMLGHNWGAAHNPRYHWAQCSLFDDGADAVFEGYSGKIRLGPALSPWLTGAVVRHAGRTLRFHALRRLLNRSVRVDARDGRWSWSFRARAREPDGAWRLDWRVAAPREDLVGLRYVNPDGSLNHCLNSKIATCELELTRGRERVARLRGTRSCAYEILTQDFDHGVAVLA